MQDQIFYNDEVKLKSINYIKELFLKDLILDNKQDVLFLLVQMRSIIELEDNKKNFKFIYLYACAIIHPNLTSSNTINIVLDNLDKIVLKHELFNSEEALILVGSNWTKNPNKLCNDQLLDNFKKYIDLENNIFNEMEKFFNLYNIKSKNYFSDLKNRKKFNNLLFLLLHGVNILPKEDFKTNIKQISFLATPTPEFPNKYNLMMGFYIKKPDGNILKLAWSDLLRGG